MKLYYSGFNLYYQIKSTKDQVIKDFCDFEYEEPFHDIIFNHTYTVLHTPNNVSFHGCVNKNLCMDSTENIEKVACADNVIFILYRNGDLCRIDTATCEVKSIPSFINVEDPSDETDFIANIVCGSNINVAVTKANRIFNIPNKLEYNAGKIKEIVTGHEHCLILTNNGDVYSFGCGIRGQLGHGTLENEINPKLIEALAGVKIVKIAAGGWHSCALSATGDLYTWGWNSNGQLALSNQTTVSVFATPQTVYFKDDPDCTINNVACGSKHTVILIGNKLYGSGWNKYNQLGKESSENIYEFKLLKDFINDNIILLKCGPWCTAVVKE